MAVERPTQVSKLPDSSVSITELCSARCPRVWLSTRCHESIQYTCTEPLVGALNFPNSHAHSIPPADPRLGVICEVELARLAQPGVGVWVCVRAW